MEAGKRLIVEPHYLGSLEFYVALSKADSILFEVSDFFLKQTFRNRCKILSSNGVQVLSVPVRFGRRTSFKEVTIDYNQSWVKDHLRGVESAYAKAPYFDYFFDEFRLVWESKPKFLIDLSMQMMTICLKILQLDIQYDMTEEYEQAYENEAYDLRDAISAKVDFNQRDIYCQYDYVQNFGSKFVPNLSVIDLLMCEGTGAADVLRRSVHKRG